MKQRFVLLALLAALFSLSTASCTKEEYKNSTWEGAEDESRTIVLEIKKKHFEMRMRFHDGTYYPDILQGEVINYSDKVITFAISRYGFLDASWSDSESDFPTNRFYGRINGNELIIGPNFWSNSNLVLKKVH